MIKPSADRAPEFDERTSTIVAEWEAEHPVALTESDALSRNDDATRIEREATAALSAARDAFKDAKTHHDGEMLRAKELRDVAVSREEMRMVGVREVHCYASKMAYTVRLDPGYEGVLTKKPRALVPSELQPMLIDRPKSWWASFGQEVIRHMAEAKAGGEELTADGIHSLILASKKYQDSTVAEVQQAMDKVEADSRAMLEARESGDDGVVVTDEQLGDEVVKIWPVDPAEVESLTETQICDLVVAFLLESGKSGPKKIANHVREHAPETTDAQVKAAILAELGSNGCRICKDGRSYKALAGDLDEAQKDERKPLADDPAFWLCVEALKGANNGLSIAKMAGLLNAEHTREDGGDFEAAHVKQWMVDALTEQTVDGLEKVTPFTYMIRI